MKYESFTLPNGLRVLTVPMPSMGSVTVSISVGFGSRYEPDRIGGAAHLLEHMLFKGTERRPSATALSDEIESTGGIINAGTDKELTVYWAKVPREAARVAFDLLADMLRHSRLRPSDITREKQVVLEELSMLQDDPQEVAYVLSDSVLWPGQPVGREIAGTPESVGALRRRTLERVVQEYYGANNAVISVAGAVTTEQVEGLVRETLADWETVAAPPALPAVPSTPPLTQIEYRPTQQTHLCLSFPAVSLNHPDRRTLDVLVAILGGGTSSRLFTRLRERLALVYDVLASTAYLSDAGAVTIYAGMDAGKIDRAVPAILTEVERVAGRRVGAAELERAKSAMRGKLWLGLEDTYSVAAWYGAQDLLRERVTTPEEAAEAIAAVTADDVLRVARTYLRPGEARAAVVGPVRELGVDRYLLGA